MAEKNGAFSPAPIAIRPLESTLTDERYLDARELAEHLRVSLRTVRNWIKAGDIPYDVLPGGSPSRRIRRFKASHVEGWL